MGVGPVFWRVEDGQVCLQVGFYAEVFGRIPSVSLRLLTALNSRNGNECAPFLKVMKLCPRDLNRKQRAAMTVENRWACGRFITIRGNFIRGNSVDMYRLRTGGAAVTSPEMFSPGKFAKPLYFFR